MRTYLSGLFLGGLVAITVIAGTFVVAMKFWPQNLIAPAISSVDSVNEKFRFIRRRPELDPQIISVGSSITWRHIDGAAFSTATGSAFLNGAAGLLAVHQTRSLARLYMDLFPRASTFVMLTSLPDFSECNQGRNFFDSEDAKSYIRAERPELFYYLKYLTIARYYTASRIWPQETVPFAGSRWLDAFGSSPLQTADRGLRYGPLAFDAACIEELKQFSSELRKRGRQLAVVVMPPRPEYRARYPEASVRLDTLVDEVEPQFHSDGNLLVDLRDIDLPSSDYWDAFHLQWSAVRRLNADLSKHVVPFVRHEDPQRDRKEHRDSDVCALRMPELRGSNP